MSIQQFSFDPDLGRAVNKNLIPASSRPIYGADHSVIYLFEKKLAPLGDLLKTEVVDGNS